MAWHAWQGSFLKSRIKRRRKTFFRQNWRRILLVSALLGAILVGVALVLPHSAVPVWAAGLLMVITATTIARSQIDGTYYLVAARDTERWTSQDLRKMLGRGWYVVDGIHFWHGTSTTSWLVRPVSTWWRPSTPIPSST